MKASDIIEYFDSLRPNSFDYDTKLDWIKSIECDIAKQLVLHKRADSNFDFMDVRDPELVLGREYKDLYLYYMISMADMTNGEFKMYTVSSSYFNSLFDKWKRAERGCNIPDCSISIRL